MNGRRSPPEDFLELVELRRQALRAIPPEVLPLS